MRSLIFTTIYLVCFFGLSVAVQQKRSAPESGPDEASSSSQKKSKESMSTELGLSPDASTSNPAATPAFVKKALDKLGQIERYRFSCTRETLMELRFNLSNKILLSEVLNQCERLFSEWYSIRTKQITYMNDSIDAWLPIVRKLMNLETNYMKVIAEKAFRSSNLGRLFYNQAWLNQALPHLRRAYFNGEGICTFFFLPPFNRVEQYFETILKDFKNIIPVKELRKNMIKGMEIFLSQKLCKRFYGQPSAALDYSTIINLNNLSKGGLTSTYQTLYKEIMSETVRSECDWFMTRKIRELHRIASLLRDKNPMIYNKEETDNLTDWFVEYCLKSMADRLGDVSILYNVDELIIKVFEEERQHIIQIISAFEMPLDKSMNEILDTRNEENIFRDPFFSRIKSIMRDSKDIVPINLYNELLTMDKSGFEQLFKDSNSNIKGVKYKLLEFLTEVFCINGYKPKISHPLLDFYYLYRITEMAQLMPVCNKSGWKCLRN